jgi:type II secretory pathway pseudopilin PulG
MLLKFLGWFGIRAITSKIKMALIGALIAASLGVIVGAYFKGRSDCAANVELANARLAIQKLQEENQLLLELVDFATQQAEGFENQEQANDQVGPALDASSPTACGLDAGWMQDLAKLR